MNINLTDKFIKGDVLASPSIMVEFFEDNLLYFDKLPENYLSFLCFIFSKKEYFDTKELWKVLHMLTTECLDESQFNSISSTLAENYHFYSNEMLCDMSCDFIASCCGPTYGLNLFSLMAKRCGKNLHKTYLCMGLNIIIKNKESTLETKDRAKKIIASISN
jgi:hypothetical protein